MRALRIALLLALVIPAATGVVACTSSGGNSSSSDSSGEIAASSSAVSFVVAGTTTYATLQVPAHRTGQKLAAALLLAGSGPTDRNGNQLTSGVTPYTLQVVADTLAKQGIMSLRFDKYFSGKTGGGRFAQDVGSITAQDFLDQAVAAYTYLSTQPLADPSKLLVLGHSEGGKYALSVAGSVSRKPAGLGLLEPADQRLLDVFRIQVDEKLNALVAQGALTHAQAISNAGVIVTAIEHFRTGQSVDLTGLVAALRPSVAQMLVTSPDLNFTRTEDRLDPVIFARAVQSGTRVLVTDGTRDSQIPPSTIGPLIDALHAAGTTGPGLQLIQDIDHDMHLPSQPATQAVLAPAVVTAIQQWAEPFASTP
ncbi:MAG: alpha/beta hydrolase [Jatrophihabitans sp.]